MKYPDKTPKPGFSVIKIQVLCACLLQAAAFAVAAASAADIIQMHPIDGSEVTEQPVMFRWTASGQAKYRITVDDDAGFFNPLLSEETPLTSFTYPLFVLDQKRRLVPGKTYYWKVEGVDSGGAISGSPLRYSSFSIEESAARSTGQLRDLKIESAEILKVGVNNVTFAVRIRNSGSGTESAVDTQVFINGRPYGRKRIEVIEPGTAENAEYLVELPPLKPEMKNIIFSALVELADDNPENNQLVKKISLPPEYFEKKLVAIKGVVTQKPATPRGNAIPVGNAVIYYRGRAIGTAVTGPDGNYEIGRLSAGKYMLRASCTGYHYTEEKEIEAGHGAVFTLDFEMVKRRLDFDRPEPSPGDKKEERFTIEQFYSKLKGYIPEELNAQLRVYDIDKIENVEYPQLNALVSGLENKTAAVTKVRLTDYSREPAPKTEIMGFASKIEGTLNVLSKGGLRWKNARQGSFFAEGDKLRTESGSSAVIDFYDRVELKMNPGTSFEILPVDRAGGIVSIKLESGMLKAQSFLPRMNMFRVVTDIAKATAYGADFSCDMYSNFTVKAYKGEIIVENELGRVTVKEGQQDTVLALSPPSDPVKTAQEDKWQGNIDARGSRTLYIFIRTSDGKEKRIDLIYKRLK